MQRVRGPHRHGSNNAKMPKDVLDELGLKPVRKGKFELSDGRIIEIDIGFATIKINIDGKEFVCISPYISCSLW